ncbi:Holliday junction branch migration protein RuvA, partial [Candidatus Uhrbacteria bacterium]|nr:Holliday junction branch migration protein RuvA [Candidatus Uhrbacteria bacterium]
SKLRDSFIVELHDVGYRVLVPQPLLERLRIGERVELYTHEVVREDRRELFGMSTADELALFHDLIAVSGVGPKTALGILSLGAPSEIRSAIAREDAAYLSKVIGIGRKTAERVVVELKGKMQEHVADASVLTGERGGEAEVLDALTQLGYKIQEVRDVIRKLPSSAGTTEEKLKVALQALGKR